MSKQYNDPHFNWLQEQPRDIWLNISDIPEHLFKDIWNYFEKHSKQFWFSDDESQFMIVENHLLNFTKYEKRS